MDRHTLRLLEYERLLELLAGCARSEPGADWCLEQTPNLTAGEVLESWKLIDEAREVTGLAGSLPVEGLVEVGAILERLSVEGAVLRPMELLMVGRVLETSRLVKSYLRVSERELLTAMAEELPVFFDLEHELTSSIGPEGEVLDTASPRLARIRRDRAGLRLSIKDRLTGLMRTKETESALQDQIITRRSGRYVIPVKVSLTRDVPGLVHDYSSSGATAYVEPLEMVEDNNRLNLLKRQEKEEIERILARLSGKTAAVAPAIADAGRLLAHLDGIFAQAELSRRQKARAPIHDPEGGLQLRAARHPLLLQRAAEGGQPVVAVDLLLQPEKRTMVISGINAGGKTVALKTMGLLSLMAATGLHLPVGEGSRITFFDNILASIGDEQDISSDLSTFSGHVRRLGWTLEASGERTLVLLDELGTGTDPAEGAALALAVLDELKNRGAWVVTATHYHLLKAWAQLTEGVENAAVMTDKGGRPTYELAYGTPGFSAGLAMAREMGLPADVVARAEGYLDEGQRKTMGLIKRLEEERAILAASRRESEALEEELAQALARYSAAEKKRAEAHEADAKAWRAKAVSALRKAEREFAEIKAQMKAESKKAPASEATARITAQFRQAKNELNQAIQPPPAPVYEALSKVEAGDRVMVRGLGKEGRVLSVQTARDRVEVDVDGVTVQTTKNDLARPGNVAPSHNRPVRYFIGDYSQAPHELNLVGLTVDEALPMVEKTLDQALLGGVKSLAIVHGVGTGRLRRAVRGFLKEHIRVKSFQPMERRLGGEGVTMVELAD